MFTYPYMSQHLLELLPIAFINNYLTFLMHKYAMENLPESITRNSSYIFTFLSGFSIAAGHRCNPAMHQCHGQRKPKVKIHGK